MRLREGDALAEAQGWRDRLEAQQSDADLQLDAAREEVSELQAKVPACALVLFVCSFDGGTVSWHAFLFGGCGLCICLCFDSVSVWEGCLFGRFHSVSVSVAFAFAIPLFVCRSWRCLAWRTSCETFSRSCEGEEAINSRSWPCFRVRRIGPAAPGALALRYAKSFPQRCLSLS